MSQPGEALIAAEAGASELHAEGAPANRLGQWSWALYEGARDPNVIFQLFIIAPFLSGAMLHDDLRGQKLWGDTVLYAGIATALLSPFFGAIADRGGPRKPWLALFTAADGAQASPPPGSARPMRARGRSSSSASRW